MPERSPESQTRNRTQANRAPVEDALERPGIREIMRLYEDWRHLDDGLEPYRTAAREAQSITTTDRANQW